MKVKYDTESDILMFIMLDQPPATPFLNPVASSSATTTTTNPSASNFSTPQNGNSLIPQK